MTKFEEIKLSLKKAKKDHMLGNRIEVNRRFFADMQYLIDGIEELAEENKKMVAVVMAAKLHKEADTDDLSWCQSYITRVDKAIKELDCTWIQTETKPKPKSNIILLDS